MIVTFNENSVTIQSDNLNDWTNYFSVTLFYSTDCAEESFVTIEEADVNKATNTVELPLILSRGVHSFRLFIAKPSSTIQERYTFFKNGEGGNTDEAAAKKALACEVLTLQFEPAYLWFYILNEAACNCSPEHFCSLWERLKKVLYADC
jgi:hypothetical protein